MNPANEAYRIQQRDRQETERLKLYRPGWDDSLTFIAEKNRGELLFNDWLSENIKDAVAQADEIQMQRLKDKWHAEYVMQTWGWTVEQYDSWVETENREQREKWTCIDFNEKIRLGLV